MRLTRFELDEITYDALKGTSERQRILDQYDTMQAEIGEANRLLGLYRDSCRCEGCKPRKDR